MSKKYGRYRKSLRLKNKKLVKKYPWLKPFYVWSGKPLKDYDYSWINWGCIYGWDIAYGDMYMKELGEAVKDQKNFQILEIKEKYGMHRVYTGGTTKEAQEIIDKYEFISQGICCQCGKPDVPMVGGGWISPECFDCFYKYHKELGQTKDDLWSLYKELAEKPNEDGTWIIPNKRTVKHWDKDGEHIEEYDISDTLKTIRDRYKKRCEHYEKRISRSRRAT